MRHALGLAALLLIAADAPPTPIPVSVPTRKEPVSYAKEVADVLEAKCTGCHSSALAEGKLNLEEVSGMLKGGKRGASVVPGKADESPLFQMASHRVNPVMPPDKKKDAKPLTSEELGLIKLWIDAGAKDDSAENPEEVKPIELGELPPGVQPVVAVDLTADGARIASGRANVVQVHDADSGLLIASLGGHKDIIQSIRFSPDGKRLAAGSYQVVTLWNLPSGSLAQTFAGHSEPVKALVATPDGKSVVSAGTDKTVRVWNLADGKPVRQWNAPAPVLALALSADGRTLAVGGADGVVHLQDPADGKAKADLTGHTGPIHDLAFLPDGHRLVSASADGSGRVWAVPSEEDIKKVNAPDVLKVADATVLAGHKGAVRSLAVSPDGQTIATGGEDATVRVWQAADGKAVRTIEGHGGPVLSLAISPKGDLLLAGSADKSARLFELASGTLRATLSGLDSPIRSVAFSPKGDRVATAGENGGLKVWETASGQGVIAFGHLAPNNAPAQAIEKIAFAGDGVLVSASADKTLKSWAFEGSWSEMKPLGPHVFRVLAIDFSPDGKLVATGGGEPSRSGEVKIWEVATGNLVRSIDALHSDTVFGLRFSPDGTKLASCAADKFLKVTNVADGKELRSYEGHTNHVLSVDWKSDGKQLITGGADNVLKVWDFDTGEQLRTLQPAGKQLTAVRWVPGKPEVAGASGDNVVRLWNPDSGAIARTFTGPSDYVFGVGITKDGKRVTAGGADGLLFLWNGENASLIRKIGTPAPK